MSGVWTQIAQLAANVTSYTNSSLTANTTYLYRVRAFNAVGNSTYSNEATVTTPAPAVPVAPSALTATALSTSQVGLAWTDNSGNESGFRIERRTTSSTVWTQIAQLAANVTSYTNSSLTANTTYLYRVRAFNAVGNSTYSNEATVTTPAPAVPVAPSALTATALSTSQVGLAWTDNSGNESGFRIERRTTSSTVWTQIVQLGANVTSYTNRYLTANTTYLYRVRAFNAVGNSTYSNEATAVTWP